MSSLIFEIPRVSSVNCTDQEIILFFADGKNISVPIAWFPRLANADAKQRTDFEILGDGAGIHWSQIDEDISVFGLIECKPFLEFWISLGN